ncbi:MAG: Photosystem I assembly protein Ycf3 [bacterium]|nr:Photosystem I assembly protein Ycf3 [bacterium]
MLELSLRFQSDEKDQDSPIGVSLFRPDSGNSTQLAEFEPPLDDAVLADLRWYLETFSIWPTGPDYIRANNIEAKLEDWGRNLLDSIIKEPKAAQLWQQFSDADGDGKLVTIDATDPRVLRLPWELLADEGGHLFPRGLSVRRRLRKTTATPTKPFSLPVRVLMVISRPEEAGFIDPRADALALLEALDGLGNAAEVEFLYPPTLAALTKRLRDKNAPAIHVVHFDGHGVYDARLGLGYLLFENDTHHQDLVDANRLGTLLSDCKVPLMVLSACQSAMQKETNPYASVAARLIRSGVGSVLAMNYSVLVAATKKFVAAFYAGLAHAKTIGQAVEEGRVALHSDEDRHSFTRRNEDGELVEETVRLRDWFLPALYQQASDPVVFVPQTQPTATAAPQTMPLALTNPNLPGGLPGASKYGFHGRSRELLQLERAFAKHAIVVLHGFGGMGKTTLAAEAGRWLYHTRRFPGGAAFVSFEHGGSLQQLCSWVGQAVSGDPNFVLGEGDPVARVARLLQEKPALVILDNFESVLGRNPLMPAEELKAVLDAVWLWATSNVTPAKAGVSSHDSRILITTRDTSFNDSRFSPSRSCRHVPLQGLAPHDALELAAVVLETNGIDRAKVNRQDLLDLMERLGGHPLSLNLVLPHLQKYTAAELSSRFEELLPGFKEGAAKERNESLEVSLQFSLQRLGDETRAALPDLAVFQGGAMEYDILNITQMSADLWQQAKQELEQAALVTAENLPNVNFPFLRFHPTLLPYLATQLPKDRRPEVENRYWREYYGTANSLYRLDTQHPHLARAIAVRELPNLQAALQLAMAAGEIEIVADFADSIASFLNDFGRWRERDAMLAQVQQWAKEQMAKTMSGEGKLTKAEFLMLDRQGDVLLQQGRAVEAEQVFQRLLQRLEAGAAYDTAYDQAKTCVWLGRCQAAQGQPAKAITWHRKALQGFERLSKSNKDAKEMLGKVYTDLADNLADAGQFDEAKQAYENGLEISREVGDQRSVGIKLGQMGTLAMRRGDLAEAARRYTEALETFRKLGEPQMEAVAWHQLGMVAEEARNWEEAERCYRESLKLKESFNDSPGVARTCNQLALVATGAGRLDDAERWYLRAQEIKDKTNPKDASTLNNLADLYLSQGRLAEAEQYAKRALAIKETLDLSAEPWTTYSILGDIAQAKGNAQEAAQWRRKEQESFFAFPGAAYQLPQWAPAFIQTVAAAAQGNTKVKSDVEKILPQLEAIDGQDLADATTRILAGERDFERLRTELNFMEAYIVRRILAALSGEPAPNEHAMPTGEATAQQEESEDEAQGITLDDLFKFVALACQPNVPPQLIEQMHGLAQSLQSPEAPPEMHAFGRVLTALLSGERHPDLSALPPELASKIREYLKQS